MSNPIIAKYSSNNNSLQVLQQTEKPDIPCSFECKELWEDQLIVTEGADYELRDIPIVHQLSGMMRYISVAFPMSVKTKGKQRWQIKTHEEKPNWGVGDYDEYYEIVNEHEDALQATEYEGLEQIADALNGFEGNLRITTALEINLHCDNQMLKMENDSLKAENSKMRKALEEIRSIKMIDYSVYLKVQGIISEAIK